MFYKLFLVKFCWFLLASKQVETARTNVTYEGLGTFTTTDFYHPIYRPVVRLPEPPEKLDVKFHLFTRKNVNQPEVFEWNVETIESNYYDPSSWRTIFILHGYIDFITWMHQIKDYYLLREDVNVIVVIFPKAMLKLFYSQSVANTKLIGSILARFIIKLQEQYGIEMDSIYLVGHSLGAHIAGYAGKLLNGTIGRITGLDPAGPYYEGLNDTRARLWYTDAQFVDSIHTNAQRHKIPFSGKGMYETCSHVDIYLNDAHTQPGCSINGRFTSLIHKEFGEPLIGIHNALFCNHFRSVLAYTESILSYSPAAPIAYRCKDYDTFRNGHCTSCGEDGSGCVELGTMAELNVKFIKNYPPGTRFFMMTGGHKPFFQYQYLVRVIRNERSTSRQIKKIIFIDASNQTQHSIRFDQKLSQQQVILLDLAPDQFHSIKLKLSTCLISFPVKSYPKLTLEMIPLNFRTRKSRNGTEMSKPITFKPITKASCRTSEILFEKEN